jgi:hypothetical protein
MVAPDEFRVRIEFEKLAQAHVLLWPLARAYARVLVYKRPADTERPAAQVKPGRLGASST